jgi:predicted dehydrogenase
VFGYHGNLVRRERPGCQDVSTVIASLRNGGSAVFNLDYLRPESASSHGDDRIRIAGSQGVLEVCDQGTRLHVMNAGMDDPSFPLVDPGRSLMGDMVAAIEGRGEPLVTAEQALSITEFAIKAERAADIGRAVPV